MRAPFDCWNRSSSGFAHAIEIDVDHTIVWRVSAVGCQASRALVRFDLLAAAATAAVAARLRQQFATDILVAECHTTAVECNLRCMCSFTLSKRIAVWERWSESLRISSQLFRIYIRGRKVVNISGTKSDKILKLFSSST